MELDELKARIKIYTPTIITPVAACYWYIHKQEQLGIKEYIRTGLVGFGGLVIGGIVGLVLNIITEPERSITQKDEDSPSGPDITAGE